MPLSTLVVLLALGTLATFLAGAGRRTRGSRPATPDDGPLGLGAGRTARCPICASMALELVSVSVGVGVGAGVGHHGEVPQVRCGSCLSSYTVRGSLPAVPTQRHRSA